MDKKFSALAKGGVTWKATYEEAEEAAKRAVSQHAYNGGSAEVIVIQAVSVVKAPVPQAEVTKL